MIQSILRTSCRTLPFSRVPPRAPPQRLDQTAAVSPSTERGIRPFTGRTMATETNAKDAKTELRSQVKQRLAGLSEKEVNDQSRKAQNTVLELPQFKDAKRVGIYLSMPMGEAQTDTLVAHSLWHSKEVFVPYIYNVGKEKPKRKVMDMLRLDGFEEYSQLERDSWGIPSLPKEGLDDRENVLGWKGRSFAPDGTAVKDHEGGGLDMIVVPGVAFDRDLNRMGHGAGFYDKFLARFCESGKRKKPYLVGLCLTDQILPNGQLVMQEWDWRMDAVAVGDGTLLTLKDTQ